MADETPETDDLTPRAGAEYVTGADYATGPDVSEVVTIDLEADPPTRVIVLDSGTTARRTRLAAAALAAAAIGYSHTGPATFIRRVRVRSEGVSPHQNKREMARRLKQVRSGQLKGSAVTDDARYAAHGLTSPNTLSLIEKP